jgi:hypothetical protein
MLLEKLDVTNVLEMFLVKIHLFLKETLAMYLEQQNLLLDLLQIKHNVG